MHEVVRLQQHVAEFGVADPGVVAADPDRLLAEGPCGEVRREGAGPKTPKPLVDEFEIN